jgi:AAA family ATPase
LNKIPHNITENELKAFASRTHGYVGADLSAVVREAGTSAIKRWMHTSSSPLTFHSTQSAINDNSPAAQLTLVDLNSSLANVRPSAMREVFVETPQVRWSDIGGQSLVQQKLRECIEWPLLHPEAFARLGVRAPKGVLLYGPPGCSKTLTARALATESGLNFIAVKGPEVSALRRSWSRLLCVNK